MGSTSLWISTFRFLISEHRVFLISWCIWDYTVFAEVRLFSFLEDSDLQIFCASCYAIHLDLVDIRTRLDELQEYERLTGGR